MASDKYHPFVSFTLLCLFFLKPVSVSAEKNCSPPTFTKDQPLLIEYFFDSEVSTHSLSPDICPIIHASKGQFSIIYRMSHGHLDKAKCSDDVLCIRNRMHACYYKFYTELYNSCPEELPPLDIKLAECVCTGAADNILSTNEALRIKYGIETVPALVLNRMYDPCFTELSAARIETYICKAYNYEIPLCK